MSEDIDKLKQRLKLDNLDEKAKKDLFEEFIDKGGQVIGGNKRKSIPVDKEKQKEYLKQVNKHKQDMSKKYGKNPERLETKSDKKNGQSKKEDFSKNQLGFILRVRGSIAGVINLFSCYINDNIFNIIKNTLQDSLLSLSYVGANLLHTKEVGKEKIRQMFVKTAPLSYEFLVRLENLYDDMEFKETLDKYELSDSKKVKPCEIKRGFKKIFRKYFMYYNYENQIIESVTDGLTILSKIKNLNKSFTDEMLLKVKNSLKIMYSKKIFDKMFVLYSLVENKYFSLSNLNDPLLLKSLNITEDEIGSIASNIKKELNDVINKKLGNKILQNIEGKSEEDEQNGEEIHKSLEKEDKEEESKLDDEELDISEHLIEGKKLFDKLDFRLPPENSSNKMKYFHINDKMFYTIIAYEFFEKEFSFLLTTNKISYSFDYIDGEKVDIKKKLSEIYVNLNSCREYMEDYLKIVEDVYKTESDASMSIMQKSSILHKSQLLQSKTSYQVRTKLLNNFGELSKLLKYSLDKKDKVVINATELLTFDKRVDGKRLLDHKTIVEANELCYSYVEFFIFMLESGFLCGSGLKIKN